MKTCNLIYVLRGKSESAQISAFLTITGEILGVRIVTVICLLNQIMNITCQAIHY